MRKRYVVTADLLSEDLYNFVLQNIPNFSEFVRDCVNEKVENYQQIQKLKLEADLKRVNETLHVLKNIVSNIQETAGKEEKEFLIQAKEIYALKPQNIDALISHYNNKYKRGIFREQFKKLIGVI